MAKWGDGSLWGGGALWGAVTLDAAGEALAGQSPAFPARQVPWRRACSKIHTFDPETWTVGDALPYVMPGATRTATRVGVGFEQQALAFQLANAPYYLTGGGAGLLARGAYLCVERTVTTATGTTTFTDGVFQCNTAPSPADSDDGATLSVTAVDWAQPLLTPASASPWVSYSGWIDYRTAYLGAGGAVVGNTDSWGTILAAIIWNSLGHRLRVESWDQFGDAPPDPSTVIPPAIPITAFQIGEPGKLLSGYDVLAFLWPLVGTFQLTYDGDGYLRLSNARRLRESGYFVTTESAVLSSLPLPWEKPLQRQISRPQYTRVDYYNAGTISTPAEGSGGIVVSEPGDPSLLHGSSVSWSSVNPHVGGDISDKLVIVENEVKQPVGFPTFTAFCEYRLGDYLGAADTINLPVDSAFPPGPTGRSVRIHVPEGGIDANYALWSYTQPLDYAPASYGLRWLADVS